MNDSYDAYGSGGGFLGSSTQDNVGTQNTPQKGSREKQSLFPVTISQLFNAESLSDDSFAIDNSPLSNVKIIGMIMKLEYHSTSLSIIVNDGSGEMEIKVFLHGDDESETAKYDFAREGIYVVVIGTLRSFHEKRNMSAYSITPMENYHQLVYHQLEVINTHLMHTQGRMQENGGTNAMGFSTPMKNSGSKNSLFATPTNQFSGMVMKTPIQGGMNGMENEVNAHQQLVLNALGTSSSETGVAMSDISNALKGQLSEGDIRGALNYLVNEGHVYSTIDEDHFKRTE